MMSRFFQASDPLAFDYSIYVAHTFIYNEVLTLIVLLH